MDATKSIKNNKGQALVEILLTITMLLGLIWGIMQIALLGTGQMALLLGAHQGARANVVEEDIHAGMPPITAHGHFLGVGFGGGGPTGEVRVTANQEHLFKNRLMTLLFGRDMFSQLAECEMSVSYGERTIDGRVYRGRWFYDNAWEGAAAD